LHRVKDWGWRAAAKLSIGIKGNESKEDVNKLLQGKPDGSTVMSKRARVDQQRRQRVGLISAGNADTNVASFQDHTGWEQG